jgi:hypothetical protein
MKAFNRVVSFDVLPDLSPPGHSPGGRELLTTVREFLRLKRKYDPDERFQSDWYRHYMATFAGTV